MIIRNDPATGRWFLHLPDEPGRPVLITDTLEEMISILRHIHDRSHAWASSNDNHATGETNANT